jgi:hypothetical protein
VVVSVWNGCESDKSPTAQRLPIHVDESSSLIEVAGFKRDRSAFHGNSTPEQLTFQAARHSPVNAHCGQMKTVNLFARCR